MTINQQGLSSHYSNERDWNHGAVIVVVIVAGIVCQVEIRGCCRRCRSFLRSASSPGETPQKQKSETCSPVNNRSYQFKLLAHARSCVIARRLQWPGTPMKSNVHGRANTKRNWPLCPCLKCLTPHVPCSPLAVSLCWALLLRLLERHHSVDWFKWRYWWSVGDPNISPNHSLSCSPLKFHAHINITANLKRFAKK
jgi:hypothetical protein